MLDSGQNGDLRVPNKFRPFSFTRTESPKGLARIRQEIKIPSGILSVVIRVNSRKSVGTEIIPSNPLQYTLVKCPTSRLFQNISFWKSNLRFIRKTSSLAGFSKAFSETNGVLEKAPSRILSDRKMSDISDIPFFHAKAQSPQRNAEGCGWLSCGVCFWV